MVSKRRFFIFIVSGILLFLLLTYQGIKTDRNLTPDFLIRPLTVIEKGISAVSKAVKHYSPVGSDVEKTVSVRGRTNGDKNRCREAEQENSRLRTLLELKSTVPAYVAASEVIARDPTNWFQILWIDKGANDGISKDMVAVTPSGVVGRVHRVLKDRAAVIQLTDINSSVAVRMQSSRVEGILEGNGGRKCSLKYVPYEAQVAAGEEVITSGLDALYPEGLLVGYVAHALKKDGEFFQKVEVVPAQDTQTVEEVLILRR